MAVFNMADSIPALRFAVGPAPRPSAVAAMVAVPRRQGRLALAAGIPSLLGVTWLLAEQAHISPGVVGALTAQPIVLAAFAFGAPGGLITALLGAATLGPFASNGGPEDWMMRAGLSVFFGVVVGTASTMLSQGHDISSRLTERLATTYGRTLYQIAESVELRDPITAGHSLRVAVNARSLGAHLGHLGPDLDMLFWAGLLHDVGKVAIPETVLQKPGPLDDAEMEVMRSHAAIGAAMIRRSSPDFVGLADAVATHHEFWDGSGYPCRLAGGSIPWTGRILAVVDVFDALTCARPYRRPWSTEEAVAELLSGSGHRFDPSIVEAFATLVSAGAMAVAPDRPAIGEAWLSEPLADPFQRFAAQTTYRLSPHPNREMLDAGTVAQSSRCTVK